jgi:hypothetical protein
MHDFRVCPGGSLLWFHPFRILSVMFGSFFPFEGQMGHYFAQFSRKCLLYQLQSVLINYSRSLRTVWQHMSFLYCLLEYPSNLLALGCGSYQSCERGSSTLFEGHRGCGFECHLLKRQAS